MTLNLNYIIPQISSSLGDASNRFASAYIKWIFNVEKIEPKTSNSYDIGSPTKKWRDLYIDKNLSDGINTLTVANAKTAYDHSQDNSQAHSDYLLNNTSDTMDGSLTLTNGNQLTVPLDASNNITYGNGECIDVPNNSSEVYVFKAGGTTSGLVYDFANTKITIKRVGSTKFVFDLGTYDFTAVGKVRTNNKFNVNGTDGITQTVVIAGRNYTHTLTFTGGILTAYSSV